MSKRFLTPVAPPMLSGDPVSAGTGSIYFNTSLKALRFYDGTSWYTLAVVGGGGGFPPPELVNGGDAYTTNWNYNIDGLYASTTSWENLVDGGGAVVH